ncbi:MAG: tetratricopeptide repeat protein [Candidatus Omnitrophica bacterium]|nr:tetratricopeptide repeat protein [Candidatus Omnitrophota bacterium]
MNKNNVPNLVIFIFFFVVCSILYFNALNNSFILDDKFLIVENQYVKNFSLQKIFSADVFSFKPQVAGDSGGYYRPLQLLSYSLEYFIWKLNPQGYRFDNILLHSINGFLIFLLIFLILKNKILAFLSGLFFCIHPAQVCLVAFIAGRSNLLETFFMFSSLFTFIYFFINRKKLFYFCSLFLYAAALLTREGALLLPVYIIICAVFLKIRKREIFFLLLPYIALALIYLILRNLFMPCDKINIPGSLPLGGIADFAVLLQSYFWQLILPLNLKIVLVDANVIVKFILYCFSFLIFIYLAVKSVVTKNKVIAFGLIIYLAGLLPLVKLDEIMRYFGPALTEHYVYNASIGFCILLAWLFTGLYLHFQKITKILFVLVCFYFSGLTVITNRYYKDEASFYKYVLSIDKHNMIAHLNLGNVYYSNKDYSKAADEVKEVLGIEPDAWDAYLLLGNIYKEQGQPQLAIAAYQKAFLLNPRSDIALNNLGLIYKEAGNYAASLGAFEQSLKIKPDSPLALENIVYLFIKNKEYDKAFKICEKITAVNPDDDKELVNVGVYWAQAERFKEAEFFLQEALRLFPSSAGAMENLGSLYGNIGEFDKAIFCFKRAQELRPLDKKLKKLLDAAIMLKKQTQARSG